MRVLVVEDDPIASRIAQVVIEKSGLNCAIVSNGELALQKCQQSHFDLVLVDVGLPDIDGFKLASKIKKTSQNESTPIYALSAHIRNPSDDVNNNTDTNGFICKPLSFDKLKDILKDISVEHESV